MINSSSLAEDNASYINMNVEKLQEELPYLFCKDAEETKKVNEIMIEAMDMLKHLALAEQGYSLYNSKEQRASLYFKKVNNHDVGKIHFQIADSSKLEKLINRIWDINGSRIIDSHFIEGKLIRVYHNDIFLIQHSYKGPYGTEGRYFYVLAKKKKIDENTYLITCVSINVNDSGDINNNNNNNNGNNKKEQSFQNPFVKSANSFSIDIDSSVNKLNTSLKKMYINLSGYVISSIGKNIDVVYVSSVQLGLSPMIPNFILKKVKANKMMLILSLKDNL